MRSRTHVWKCVGEGSGMYVCVSVCVTEKERDGQGWGKRDMG